MGAPEAATGASDQLSSAMQYAARERSLRTEYPEMDVVVSLLTRNETRTLLYPLLPSFVLRCTSIKEETSVSRPSSFCHTRSLNMTS